MKIKILSAPEGVEFVPESVFEHNVLVNITKCIFNSDENSVVEITRSEINYNVTKLSLVILDKDETS